MEHHASFNLKLDRFSARYIERMSTAICPTCQHKTQLGRLIVRPDGTWVLE